MRKSWLFPGDTDEPYVSQRAGAYQPQSEKRRRWTKRLVILALILCVLYPFVEPYTLRTTQTAITCEDLPRALGSCASSTSPTSTTGHRCFRTRGCRRSSTASMR